MSDLFVSGGTAGFMYWVLFYPLDVIKSALQTDAIEPEKRRFPCGVRDAAGQLWKEGGVARFYRGVTPCLLRAIPANAIMLIVVVRAGAAMRVGVLGTALAAGGLTRAPACPRASQTKVRGMLGP